MLLLTRLAEVDSMMAIGRIAVVHWEVAMSLSLTRLAEVGSMMAIGQIVVVRWDTPKNSSHSSPSSHHPDPSNLEQIHCSRVFFVDKQVQQRNRCFYHNPLHIPAMENAMLPGFDRAISALEV
jgi:hypothetical protein